MLYVRRGSNRAFAADFFSPKEFSPACKREGFGNGAKAALGAFLGGGVRMHRMVLRRRGRVPKAGERSET